MSFTSFTQMIFGTGFNKKMDPMLSSSFLSHQRNINLPKAWIFQIDIHVLPKFPDRLPVIPYQTQGVRRLAYLELGYVPKN